MWFKQVQVFQLNDLSNKLVDGVASLLEPLAFSPCLPSMADTVGWVAPVDEEGADLARNVNGNIMLCIQFEEKILPATVINQAVVEKIKHIEQTADRKVRQKEKLALKDQVVTTLLPRAFSKLSRVYAYIDTKNHWLVLGTANANKTEKFIDLFKKSITDKIKPVEIKKIAPTITHWLQHQSYPTDFAIEKTCVLQDPNQQKRVIRCQQQDLFAGSIQSLLKDGCEVKQLALSWQDRVNFILTTDFIINSLSFNDELTEHVKELEVETKQQLFDADLFIMSETLSGLLKALLTLFINTQTAEPASIMEVA